MVAVLSVNCYHRGSCTLKRAGQMVNMAASSIALVQRAAHGYRAALTELLERHGPAVRVRFQSQIPKRWQSVLSLDDLMQETYTDAFLDFGEFAPQDDNSFEHWLEAIAKHNLSDALRMLEAEKRGGDRKRIEMSKTDESFVALYDLLSHSGTTPSRAAAKGEVRTALKQAVEQLPTDYRRVVQLYDLEGAMIGEVSKALDRRPGAVFMLRARAHRALSKLLGSSSNFFSDSA